MHTPINKPSWMTGVAGPEVVQPPNGKKAAGWAPDERPPAEYMNWLFQNISDWVDYIQVWAPIIEAAQFQYKAIIGTVGVGSPATHATLAAALADVAVPNGSRIFILEDQNLAAPVTISKNNIEIVFAGGKGLIKSAGTKGLIIQGLNCRILGGRIAGYSTGGDIAIEVQAGAKNCMIRDVVFANCDTEISDLSTNTSIIGSLTEE